MAWLERLAYLIKQRFPGLFALVEAVARGVSTLRFGRRIGRALARAEVRGSVRGQAALMRPLGLADLELLHRFLAAQTAEHLRYFRPHDFDPAGLKRVLASTAFLNYGLFVGERLVAYALLKVAPTGSAFIGLLVDSSCTGLGLGRFIARYLYWQASLAGLRARSISRHNPASLRSHQAVADFRAVWWPHCPTTTCS